MSFLPYEEKYSAPYAYNKNGKYKLTSSLFLAGNLSCMGSLPKEVDDARQRATGDGNCVEVNYKNVRDYISKAETFKVLLAKDLPKYKMQWEWSSYHSGKSETTDNLNIEKAMFLIRLVFKYIDECLKVNHIEPILNGTSFAHKILDGEIINRIISNYKSAEEILVYIIDLEIEDCKFPELNRNYLKGLLYYIEGLELIFEGYSVSYNPRVQQISLYYFIDPSYLNDIHFDNGILSRYYATAAEFIRKAHEEFTNSLVQANPSVKAISDPLNDRCCLLMHFYRTMSYLLYGIPTMNLFEYNSKTKITNISPLKPKFNMKMEVFINPLRYIKRVKSMFAQVTYTSLYNKVQQEMKYYSDLVDKVESSFREEVDDGKKIDDLVMVDRLKKEPNPIIIASSLTSNCKFSGYALDIPSSMIVLPTNNSSAEVEKLAISLLFPDISQIGQNN